MIEKQSLKCQIALAESSGEASAEQMGENESFAEEAMTDEVIAKELEKLYQSDVVLLLETPESHVRAKCRVNAGRMPECTALSKEYDLNIPVVIMVEDDWKYESRLHIPFNRYEHEANRAQTDNVDDRERKRKCSLVLCSRYVWYDGQDCSTVT
ncbi:hypothetical protein K458DRAFT_406436 [Lentithecium fluviatile CBS 122367]|uniref:Uncharacterized protein n=1 Tax=Lentithecium fluviatile CBS 122367 TaxID=1168545 RepID=A0A6G1ITE6_9PLEO|nr:hypothetical protein K458DRAFT_406436 [Lentithecium fluviatile CBS 122367]